MEFNEIKQLAKSLGVDGWASKSVQDLQREMTTILMAKADAKALDNAKIKKAAPKKVKAVAKPKAAKKAPAKKKK